VVVAALEKVQQPVPVNPKSCRLSLDGPAVICDYAASYLCGCDSTRYRTELTIAVGQPRTSIETCERRRAECH